ncbi:hypothetical protein BH09ACT6_BH09ACT6_15340 [soil metagenome]
MAKYILIYRGPAAPPEEMTSEMGDEQMALWGAWMGKAGPSIIDGGAPFGARTALLGDGSTGEPGDVHGYTVVEADSMDAANALCDGHPFLSTGTPEFSVDIYELIPM